MILAINTASSKTAIALLKGGKKTALVAEKSWKSHSNEAEKLMPEIAELLKNQKVKNQKFSSIKKVIVIKGPGSFTGLRIGVTAANTIAYLNKCEIFGIDVFEYFWSALSSVKQNAKLDNKNTALLIFAGSGGVYVSIPNKKPELVNLSELNRYLRSKNIKKVFGDISNEQKKILKNIKFEIIKKSFGKIIEQKFRTGTEFQPETLIKIIKPYYIKLPGITKSKNHIKCYI